MSDRVRVGVVGGGRIADLNCIGWLEHPAAEIVAVCDVDEAVRERRSREWDARPYASYEDLLADDTVDAVEILTPHQFHVDQAIAALEAGKHVSLQKPPARSLEEYDRLAPVVAGTDRVFRVFENFTWYPPHRLARELVDAGEIGEPLSVRIVTAAGRMGAGQGWDLNPVTYIWRMQPELCGGGMNTFDHGYHSFQMGRTFISDPVEVVHAFINWIEIPGGGLIDAPALISWRYSGVPRYGSWEIVASLDLDVRSKYYVTDDRLEIRGTSGIIWVTRCAGQAMEEPPLVVYRDGVSRAYHTVEADWAASFRDATFDFIDAIREGRPAQLDLAEGRATLAFALAAQLSSHENREVVIAEMG